MVCSNLGPDMALALGFWLLDQVASLFGACEVRRLSASSTFSCNAADDCGDSLGSSLVLETFGTCFEGFESLTTSLSLAVKA